MKSKLLSDMQKIYDEVKRLQEVNSELVNALKLAEFYVRGYIGTEEGHGNDCTPCRNHLKEIKALIKKSSTKD